jgi:CotH protein/putative metal-binding protein
MATAPQQISRDAVSAVGMTARQFRLIPVLVVIVSCTIDDPRPATTGGGGSPDPSAGRGEISGFGGMSLTPSSGAAGAAGATGVAGANGGTGGPFMPGPCADIFADDLFPTYELQIAPAEWDALVNDFNTMLQNIADKKNYHPYHALAEFKYGNEVVTNALIRLKGWSSWWQAANDKPPKMQFVIAFNEIDSHGRFHGQRKIELDMPRIDPTYVHQRMSLAYLRQLGLPAQCANNARVFINGAFYGLFTNMERPDKEFIRRLFPGADRGDLWDGGWELATNEDTMGLPHPRLDAFWAATTVEAIAAIADMDEALQEWAAEAMLADPDGYWIGHWNWFIYDHPGRGWLWIPHDFDVVINWTDPRIDPMYYWAGDSGWAPPRQHYLAVIKDQTWSERYVAALRRAQEVYTAAQLPEMLDRFTAQVRDAAAADPTRPFSFDDHLREVANLRQAFTTRADSVRAWLDCRAAPDSALDADGDRRPFCMDCKDSDPATYPGAVEICGDGRDQDCDGTDPPCQ